MDKQRRAIIYINIIKIKLPFQVEAFTRGKLRWGILRVGRRHVKRQQATLNKSEYTGGGEKHP